MRAVGVSSARGSHAAALSADKIIKQARQRIAALINAADVNEIAFTNSGTDALSTAILGTLNAGDHAITSAADHNSVIRPLTHLRDAGVIELTIVDCDQYGFVSADSIAEALKANTKLVALTHASNVLGTIQPVQQIGQHCTDHGALFLLDAAQTIGHIPIDVQTIGCDMLAAPGHKGLLGPLGTGVLHVTPKAAKTLVPLRFGGTGSQRVDEGQPTMMPAMLEAGSLNVPAIAGLLAGVDFVNSTDGQERIAACQPMLGTLLNGLRQIQGVSLFGQVDDGSQAESGHGTRLPVVAFSVAGFDSTTVAGILDSSFQIQTRAGFHCAPRLHQSLGTDQDGLVRVSIGPFNSPDDIAAILAAITEISSAA